MAHWGEDGRIVSEAPVYSPFIRRKQSLPLEWWVALPAAVRQQLGLSSGDRLDVALLDGTIVLRLAAKATRPVQHSARRRRSIPLPRMRLGPRLTRM